MYGGSNNAAGAARQQEEERQQRINEGRRDIDAKFATFDSNFYDKRARDYESYALPQLATQERDTRNQLAAALARKGLLNSGAAIKGNAKLDQYTNQKRQDVAMAGLEHDFLDRARPTVLVHFGDHQPSFDSLMST